MIYKQPAIPESDLPRAIVPLLPMSRGVGLMQRGLWKRPGGAE